MREAIIQKVLDKKIIAIVRGVYGQDCVNLARVLQEGGIELLEVTFDQSQPENLTRTADTVKQLNETLGDKMLFGAGTVTDLNMLKLAREAGAKFIVSPDTREEVIRATVAEGMVSMPGAMTPTEIQHAWKCGADFVKLFPASTLGCGYLKAVRGPLNHIRILAVGGVNDQNIGQFLAAGAVGAGVGGNLVNKQWIANGEFDRITELARSYVQKIQ